MTEEQVLKLHGIKGTLTAYVTIQQVTIKVAQESQAGCTSSYMDGHDRASIELASKAIEQHLVVMAEIDDLLKEVHNG